MVFVTEQSPWCCCPPAFNNETRRATATVPKPGENTVGPWAAKLTSLDHFKQNDVAVNSYPYCPVMDENEDKIMCVDYTYDSGGGTTTECPKTENKDTFVEEQDDIQSAPSTTRTTRTSASSIAHGGDEAGSV